jgi:hypothetical protein
MINVVVEVKFSFNDYSQIFSRISPEYRGLADIAIKFTSLVFLEKYITDVEFQQCTNLVQA